MVTRGLLTGAEQRYTVARLRVREREAVMTARRDPLTGLDNRTAMHDRLASLLADRGQLGIALALLDLDDFKDINDTHGHDTGDAVLREVARRLCVAAPAGALVARLGGDEFAVCVPAPAGPHSLGDALLDAFRQPVVIGTRPFTITASIGVVMADADGGSAAVALSHVDVAMYQAKARKDPHRSGVVVLNGQAREHAAARVQMRDDVSHPQVDQFHVVYEPVVDLRDGRVVGAEALLRWDHPLLGRVAPADFIPLAEQVGAIAELGEFALRTAVADLASWLATAEASGHPLADGSVGVNLSPRQLGVPGLCDLVQSILAEHHLEPNRLVLEITEEALLDDWSTAIEVVQGLRSIGVGVAVDDFGTGYSSLRYLRRFDTSIVKIDREFVQAVVDEPRTRALVASVLEMARSLELSSVAEGIETLDQLQVLRALGCRLAQGYLFDKPMRAQAFGALLVDGHRYPMGAHPQSVAVPLPSPRSADLAVLPRQTG
jgi:diguanylate cyclase (GGDEF)-like protein